MAEYMYKYLVLLSKNQCYDIAVLIFFQLDNRNWGYQKETNF